MAARSFSRRGVFCSRFSHEQPEITIFKSQRRFMASRSVGACGCSVDERLPLVCGRPVMKGRKSQMERGQSQLLTLHGRYSTRVAEARSLGSTSATPGAAWRTERIAQPVVSSQDGGSSELPRWTVCHFSTSLLCWRLAQVPHC